MRILTGSSSADHDMCSYLVDIWGAVKDVDVNGSLLKDLILRYVETEAQMKTLNEELNRRRKALLEEFAVAAGLQKTLLPTNLPESELFEIAYKFLPCEQVGGDLVGLQRLDEQNWIAWVVDVAGHGASAAMMTVAVADFLQPSSRLDFLQPSSVMEALDREFPFSKTGTFFTIIYGIVNLAEQTFTFANSGHPCPVLLQPGCQPRFIDGSGPMLGVGFSCRWPEVKVDLKGGKSLLLYTDGLVECIGKSEHIFGEQRLLEMLERLQDQPPHSLADSIMSEMHGFMGDKKFQDDFTFLVLKAADKEQAV